MHRGRAALVPFVIAGLGFAGPVTAQTVAGPPPGFDAYVSRVMQAFEVPGVAVTIVKDGAVVLAKGYGVRRLGEDAPVDAHTRFGIASNTKAFTATALALLVEEGRLQWDAPVITYLPWFQMWDPWVTREITVRDLLVHRSGLGLGEGDLLGWPPSTRTREEIVRQIRWLKPATSFRSAYAYDNVLYHAAALVIEAVSGQTWEEFVSSRIVGRLGMSETRVSRASTREPGNVAAPHARVDGVVRPVQPFDATNTNASGGVNSTATDMAKWLIVQLDSGRMADGTWLFTPRTTRELWSPVTPMPISRPAPGLEPLATDYRGYALAFIVQEYRGHKLVTHTGSLPGYVSRVAMIPDQRLGVAVLTNQEAGEAFDAIAWHVLDHYLRAPATDWLAGYQAARARGRSGTAAAGREAAAGRGAMGPASLPLDAYAGTYRDAWYGDVTIAREADGLVIRFSKTPVLVGDLEHFGYDTFIARWRDRTLRADAYVTFSLAPGGAIEEVRLRAVSPATDFSYDFQDLLLRPVRR
jgi:CubicO group peptidase (beta-lactamase class C family)